VTAIKPPLGRNHWNVALVQANRINDANSPR
jgi:hypothetical protein